MADERFEKLVEQYADGNHKNPVPWITAWVNYDGELQGLHEVSRKELDQERKKIREDIWRPLDERVAFEASVRKELSRRERIWRNYYAKAQRTREGA